MTPDDRAVVVGGDPRRLERYVTGCRWAWLAAVVLAGAIALLEHERQGGASLTILAVAVVGAVASLPLWARRLRLTTLALSTAVVAAAPLASLAWMALAIVGDFPEQAALARRYWVVYQASPRNARR